MTESLKTDIALVIHNGKDAQEQDVVKNGKAFNAVTIEDASKITGNGNHGAGNDDAKEDPWVLPDLQDDSVPWNELTRKEKWIRVGIGFGRTIALLLLLYLFICTLDFLSSSLRLLAGKQATNIMTRVELLKNPVVGLMLGVIATVLMQSSSTSTSVVITMVGSGLLEVKYSIPIIMGANIGTSVTNTIVSFGQAQDRNTFRRAFAAATVHDMFNWLTVVVLLPIEVGTGFLEYISESMARSTAWEQNKGLNKAFLTVITKPFTSLIIQLDKKVLDGLAVNKSAYENASLMKHCCNMEGVCKNCGYLLEYFNIGDIGAGVLLLILSILLLSKCLYYITRVLKSVLSGKFAVVLKKLFNAEPRFPLNHLVGYLAIVIGCGMTILVQSSSVFTSALTPLAGIGVISIERIYPLTLGSNVGTTTTGILAAISADPKRLKYTLQIAFCHMFFNLGGILLFYPIPFLRFPIPLAKMLGNITAKYRWFSGLYLLSMFIVIPVFVFALSVAGSVVFMAIGIPLLCAIILVIFINILQKKCPLMLPHVMRNWNYLPKWMHSLEPADRILTKIRKSCRCCRCSKASEPDRLLDDVIPNDSKENINSCGSPIIIENNVSVYENIGFPGKNKIDSDVITRL